MVAHGRRRKRIKHVALMLEGGGYCYEQRQIEQIIEYYRRHADWRILSGKRLQPFVSIDDLVGWEGDGVICQAYSEEDVDGLVSLGIPVVNTSSYAKARCFPTVSADNFAIGALAARHLMERNLDHFAYVGETEVEPDRTRLQGFRQTLETQGIDCVVMSYELKRERGRLVEGEHPSIHVEPLAKLEFPVGVFASSDRTGYAVLEACRQLEMRCPEDVLLIGVDNSTVYCTLPQTTMSSIDPAAGKIGYRAAQMLDRLMNGQEVANQHVLVPPSGIQERHSTEVIRYKYPEVARAMRFIRRREGEFIYAADVVAAVPVSRRWLEMKFKEEVGHGIYHEIRRVHVKRAKRLLLETDWSVSRISRECGFNSGTRFDVTFQELTGMTASQYRETNADVQG
jgi:LacI family transcriptional regulator